MPVVQLIGAGRLGQTLGRLLSQGGLFHLGGVYTPKKEKGLLAVEWMGGGEYVASIAHLPPADITLIATPDDAIPSMAKALSHNPFLKEGSLVVHCSGVLTSDELLAVKARGCVVASVHPMRSFADPTLSVEQYRGTYCAIEGDEEGVKKARALFDAIGSVCYRIEKQKKALYHAAGVYASNYVITLFEKALGCMRGAGVDDALAKQVMLSLMKGTLSNVEQSLSSQDALTGPLKRGDEKTIQLHLNTLETPEEKACYAILGQATLPLTRLSDEKKLSLMELLDSVKHE